MNKRFRKFGDIPATQARTGRLVAMAGFPGFRMAIKAAAEAENDGLRAAVWMANHGLTTDTLRTMTVVELARYLDMMGRDDVVPASVLRTLARLKVA